MLLRGWCASIGAVQAHQALGETYLGLLRGPEAEEQFRLALKIQPKEYLAWEGLGDALRLEHQLDKALDAYAHAATLDQTSQSLDLPNQTPGPGRLRRRRRRLREGRGPRLGKGRRHPSGPAPAGPGARPASGTAPPPIWPRPPPRPPRPPAPGTASVRPGPTPGT